MATLDSDGSYLMEEDVGSQCTSFSSSGSAPSFHPTRPITAPVSTTTINSDKPRANMAPCQSTIEQNVRVVARVRPLSSKELSENSAECLVVEGGTAIRVASKNDGTKRFEFDATLGPHATQLEVYEKTAGDMIRNTIYRGFNGTILAYGQTGSGKTFTMGTDGGHSSPNITSNKSVHNEHLIPPSSSDGVIARAVYDLFRTRSDLERGHERVKIEMSYLEIYNEQAIDLLSDDTSAVTLQVRDSKSEGVVIPNLKSFVVKSPVEVSKLMERASAKRATGSTQMNLVSSRSHAICTINVTIAPLELEENDNATTQREIIRAKLTLVDLAGSERIKKTGAEGARMKEGININKGLFVLGQVVSSLSELGQIQALGGKKGSSHIPYRDSKLTRLLQDSLGGNSRTVMIACISPAESNAEESINTLRYAERTRNIQNSAVRNVVATGLSAIEAAALQKENELLKMELSLMRSGSMSSAGNSSLRPIPAFDNSSVVVKLKSQCSAFLAENELLKERVKSHAHEVLEASLRADKWQDKFDNLCQRAKEEGIDLPAIEDGGERTDIVIQLRHQLNECKTELLEARADAAVARVTAGAIIKGNGVLASLQDTITTCDESFSEDDDSQKEYLSNELSAVSGTIEQKEAMLQYTLKERACRETLQVHHANSLHELQIEVDNLTAERNELAEQMNKDHSDCNNRRKRKTAENPVTKKLREQISRLEERIDELKCKANEHTKSMKMKEEAEKKCVRLMDEITEDKRRRADLQKKLKEVSVEIRNEKKAAQQNAARLMKDSQKLKIELSKIKSAAEKQAAVLKRKIDESAAKEKARLELEKKRRTVERMRLVSSSTGGDDDIDEKRKQDLESWIDCELEYSVIKSQINDHKRQLEDALTERKRLLKSQGDTVDVVQLESVEDDCRSLRAAINDLESNAKRAFPTFEGCNPLWRFVDSNIFKGLSKQEAKYLVTYIFDACTSTKHELDSVLLERDMTIKLAIDSEVVKERQVHEMNLMKLKMEHGEATLNLLESTQGAVSSSVSQMITTNADMNTREQLQNILDSYVHRCMSTRNAFKSDLNEMKESEEGMQKMMEDVTQGTLLAPATSRKLKKRINYESEVDEEIDESFEVEVDDSSDYRPTPTPAKRRRAAKKPQIDSPLLGENFLDEDGLASMTVQALREVCRKNNLSAAGKKSDLCARLKEMIKIPKTSRKKINFELDSVTTEEFPHNQEISSPSDNVKKSLWTETGDEACKENKPMLSSNIFRSVLETPTIKSNETGSSKIQRPVQTTATTPSKLSRSPKRKRSPDLGVNPTPIMSAKKYRPLGFLASSPRLSPPSSVDPHCKQTSTAVLFNHTISTAKKLRAQDGKKTSGVSAIITASARKRTKRGMNAAVARALEQCDGKI